MKPPCRSGAAEGFDKALLCFTVPESTATPRKSLTPRMAEGGKKGKVLKIKEPFKY